MNTQYAVRFGDMPARYDAVSRVLHWLSLLLLVAQFSLGWLMPDADSVQAPAGLVAWHVGIGTSLLALFAARLVWAAMRRSPGPVDQHGGLRFLAAAVHVSMYALLLLVPLLGWLNASGRGWVVRLAGVLDLPPLATPDSLGASIGEWHSTSGNVPQTVEGWDGGCGIDYATLRSWSMLDFEGERFRA
ncbi:cytochrome b, partial [Paraburkholderia phenoliruptrix]|uniref:cytochrome b n=1 Tax=Paraburkholderia phenoliruptrix TaxID=252970 RepID=UPI001581CB3D